MNYVPEQAMVQALEQTPAPVQRTQTPTGSACRAACGSICGIGRNTGFADRRA